jgi:hypothetical protein
MRPAGQLLSYQLGQIRDRNPSLSFQNVNIPVIKDGRYFEIILILKQLHPISHIEFLVSDPFFQIRLVVFQIPANAVASSCIEVRKYLEHGHVFRRHLKIAQRGTGNGFGCCTKAPLITLKNPGGAGLGRLTIP